MILTLWKRVEMRWMGRGWWVIVTCEVVMEEAKR